MTTTGQPLPPLPPAPTVAVVVPARDAAATLERAVRSALAQASPGPMEVAIAVGPSRDATRAIADRLAAEDPRIAVVDNPSGATPAALNAAIAASTGQVVVRLDGHALLPVGYVATAVDDLRETGAANVGGRQVPVATEGFAAAVATAMTSPAGAGGATYRTGTEPGPTDTVYLGVFRREALEAVGGYDETLLRNQDYELNVRLRDAGWTVWFDPRLEVAYTPRGSLRSLARQYHDYGRWKRHVVRQHPGSVRARQLAPPLLVGAVAVAVVASVVLRSVVPLALIVGAEVVVVVLGGFLAGGVRRGPAVALALLTMHLAWGVGFLRGVGRDAGVHRHRKRPR